MVFSGFNAQLVIRLALIVITSFAATWILQLTGYWLLKLNMCLLLLLQGYLLFRFISRWRKDLKIFATAVKQRDFSITFQTDHENEAFAEMYSMLNEVSRFVRQVKSESVQQNQYFQYVVENAQVGLIAYDSSGEVLISNQEARRITGTATLKNLALLRTLNNGLFESVDQLPLNQPRLITLKGNEVQKISARLSEIAVGDRRVFLLSLMNIKSELDENELQSWQDLINVLTHEIMNSITPINSMTGSMMKYLDRIEGNTEHVERARNSLNIISRRSAALMDFVGRYRAISDVPLPRRQEVSPAELINAVLLLMSDELADINVTTAFDSGTLLLDSAQIEQVLINLFRNAINAVADKNDKSIRIEVSTSDGKCTLSVTDNGRGIPREQLDKIFIPFYTTRKEGSGIGLTLSKQIMHRHGGHIEVSSEQEHGTTFRLVFPAT